MAHIKLANISRAEMVRKGSPRDHAYETFLCARTDENQPASRGLLTPTHARPPMRASWPSDVSPAMKAAPTAVGRSWMSVIRFSCVNSSAKKLMMSMIDHGKT